MSAVATRTLINLQGACDEESCSHFAFERYTQLNVPKYSDQVSILEVPDTLDEWRWQHRTARKRADRAEARGYRFQEVDLSQYNDDVYDINTSLPTRQGRPMSAGYRRRVNRGPLPHYPCLRHRIHTYGVLHDARLRAYLTLYRVGELGLVSMILAHGESLRDEIMYLLFQGVVREQCWQGGWFFYNSHSSGTDGLRFFKERLGFQATDVEWAL